MKDLLKATIYWKDLKMPRPKPRRVKCKLTRTVTEIVIAILDKDGNVEEIEEIYEEQNYEVTEIHDILTVLSVHSY